MTRSNKERAAAALPSLLSEQILFVTGSPVSCTGKKDRVDAQFARRVPAWPRDVLRVQNFLEDFSGF